MTSNEADRAVREGPDEELQFLLRSLDDLDRERAAGSLSEKLYAQLHAEYTARTADVARAAGRARPGDAPRSTDARPRGGAARQTAGPARGRAGAPRQQAEKARRRGTATASRGGRISRRARRRRLLAVVVAVLLGGFGLTGVVTGLVGGAGSPAASGGAGELASLRRAVQQHPGDASAHDALATALTQAGDVSEALREFDTAASLDPGDALALAYSGWITLLAGDTGRALDRLNRAEAADPGFPDTHAFRGITLLRSGGNRDEALSELQRYLELAPGGALAQQVRDVLGQAAPPPGPAGQPPS